MTSLLIALLLQPSQLPPAKENPVPASAVSPALAYSYEEGYKICIRNNWAMIVWVGQPIRSVPFIDNHINVKVDSLEGASSPSVIIAKVQNGKLVRLADLPGKPSFPDIQHVFFPPLTKQNYAVPRTSC